ncbi:MAG: hypothetical protein ACI90V_010353, partial [Bacillariaceae sp.]
LLDNTLYSTSAADIVLIIIILCYFKYFFVVRSSLPNEPTILGR